MKKQCFVGAIGGTTDAAIGSSPGKIEKIVVRETIAVKEMHDGPPGYHKGKKKGWKKHHHHDS